MTAGVRAKILAASDYLDVAPTVVEVVRTRPPSRFRTAARAQATAVSAVARRWGLAPHSIAP
jgi:hypothetical protein